eukprot:13342011-Alexandrium_andersonii.AAC.1
MRAVNYGLAQSRASRSGPRPEIQRSAATWAELGGRPSTNSRPPNCLLSSHGAAPISFRRFSAK